MKVTIWLHGEIDSTPIEMEVTDDELNFLRKISKLSNDVAVYPTMPVLDINEEITN